MKTQRAKPMRTLVGHSYGFTRENHDWHACEVSVLSIKGRV